MADLFKLTQQYIDFKRLGKITQQLFNEMGKSRLKITVNDLRNWNDKEKARQIHERFFKDMG